MTILKPAALLLAISAIAGVSAVSANAQTSPTSPPAATRPETAPMPQTPPAQKPMPRPGDKSATVPANPLIGLSVFSSDGSKLGTVQSVATAPDGKATAIHVKTGGFLGLGGKLVAIQDGKFTKSGDRVQLSMTADEVSKLPEYKGNI